MATVTLTVTDLDLAAGSYRVDFHADGNEIDDGRATAAYFTGFYLNTLVNTPDFLDGCITFGKELIEAVTRDAPDRPMTTDRATMRVVLEDKDLDTGRMSVTLEAEGGDMSGESLPTTAQIVGAYMRSLLTDAEFRAKVWAFADEFVANNGEAELTNPDQRAA